MKRNSEHPMVRWRDRRPGDAAPEDRAAEIVRGVLVPAEPDGLQLARIERRLRAREGGRGRSSLASRMAFAGAFLVAGAATAKAYDLVKTAGWLEWSRPAKAPSPTPAPAPSERRFVRPAPATTAANAVAPTQETVEPATELALPNGPAMGQGAPAVPSEATTAAQPALVEHSQARLPRRTASVERVWPGIPPASPDRRAFAAAEMPMARASDVLEAPSVNPQPAAPTAPQEKTPAAVPATGAAEEARTLDQAIGLLRRDHQPAAALPMLDSYLRRYPRGILTQEARLARVDALLMLERSQEALAALEALPLDTGRRSAELQVVRGELRARLDCAHAESDFTAALTHSPDAGLLERILYGRGVCRAKLGNRSGSVDDLRRYLERFPNGAYAGPVRRWLDTTNKSPEKGG